MEVALSICAGWISFPGASIVAFGRNAALFGDDVIDAFD